MNASDFDSGLVQWFTTLGVGGAIAAFMFIFYRKDMLRVVEMQKTIADMQTTFADMWKSQLETSLKQNDVMMKVLTDNTSAFVELRSEIRNGRLH